MRQKQRLFPKFDRRPSGRSHWQNNRRIETWWQAEKQSSLATKNKKLLGPEFRSRFQTSAFMPDQWEPDVHPQNVGTAAHQEPNQLFQQWRREDWLRAWSGRHVNSGRNPNGNNPSSNRKNAVGLHGSHVSGWQAYIR
ncbi:MAG: hypothetical protein ACTHLW_20645 [Verrucomicrobiota bacterium]